MSGCRRRQEDPAFDDSRRAPTPEAWRSSTGYVILGGEIDVPALEASWPRTVDWNVVIAKFLNALDMWVTAYTVRGPGAVGAAIRFSPCAATGGSCNIRDALHALAR